LAWGGICSDSKVLLYRQSLSPKGKNRINSQAGAEVATNPKKKRKKARKRKVITGEKITKPGAENQNEKKRDREKGKN